MGTWIRPPLAAGRPRTEGAGITEGTPGRTQGTWAATGRSGGSSGTSSDIVGKLERACATPTFVSSSSLPQQHEFVP